MLRGDSKGVIDRLREIAHMRPLRNWEDVGGPVLTYMGLRPKALTEAVEAGEMMGAKNPVGALMITIWLLGRARGDETIKQTAARLGAQSGQGGARASEVAWQTGGRATEGSPREDDEGGDITVIEVNGFPVDVASRLGVVLKSVADRRKQTRDWDCATVIKVERELDRMSDGEFEECVRKTKRGESGPARIKGEIDLRERGLGGMPGSSATTTAKNEGFFPLGVDFVKQDPGWRRALDSRFGPGQRSSMVREVAQGSEHRDLRVAMVELL